MIPRTARPNSILRPKGRISFFRLGEEKVRPFGRKEKLGPARARVHKSILQKNSPGGLFFYCSFFRGSSGPCSFSKAATQSRMRIRI